MDVVFGCCSSVNTAVIAVTISILCIYLYRHFTSLKRAGFDGPTPWPLIGNLGQQLYWGIGETDAAWRKKYGKVFGYYNGFKPQYHITDPEVLKSILVKDFTKFMDRPCPKHIPKLMSNALFFMQGRTWKKTRNILTPSFSASSLKQFMPALNKCAGVLAKNFSSHIDEDVQIRDFFTHFTMDAIASTAFGIEVDSQSTPDDPFVSNIDQIFKPGKWRRFIMILALSVPPIGTLMRKFNLHIWPTKVMEFYETTGQMLIDDRKKNKTSAINFIQMLLEAEFDSEKLEHIHHGANLKDTANGHQNTTPEKLSDDVINAQAFLFFLAGFETTASLLRYAAYVLATHPDIDSKLYDEVVDNIGEDEPTYDNVATLKYMDMFIDEVLRRYPPLVRLTRTVNEDVIIEGKRIPKGSAVIMPLWLLHNDPEYFPDPDTFDPQRFSPEKKNSAKDGVTYLPFGAGPRHCIGMRLALVEAKIALVHLLRKIKFAKCEKTQVPLDFTYFGLLRPKKPIFLRVQQR